MTATAPPEAVSSEPAIKVNLDMPEEETLTVTEYRLGAAPFVLMDVSPDFKDFEITVAGMAGAPFAVKARFLRHAHDVLTKTVEALPPEA